MGIICGVDIIEIERIKKCLEPDGDSFRNKVFTGKEISYCEGKRASRFQSYAARFAAKEAVSKALGTGISRGVSWKDMEILNNEHGQPYLVLKGKAEELFEELKGKEVSLSLSHCQNYAVAYVVIQTNT